MPKFVHRAKTLPAIPMDYYARFDAFTPDDMTLGTGNVVDAWQDQCGRVSTFVPGTYGTNKPVYVEAADGRNYVQLVDTDKALKSTYTGADLDAHDLTIFMVCNLDKDAQSNTSATGSRAPGGFLSPRGSSAATQPTFYHQKTGFVSPTNGVDDKVTIWSGTVLHNGVDDNDVEMFIGDTSIASGAAATDAACTGAPAAFMLGNYADASSWTCEVRFYEIIIWDRVLTPTEHGYVVDYLSNKWGASNQDAASEVVTTASTAATWQNTGLDPDGQGILTHPGKQKGEYSIVRLGDRDAPRVSGNSKYDNRFPMTQWGSSVKFYFDASATSGMTFATGSASAGGTVSSWTDLTGAVTMNTTTSGDSAMDYVLGKRPALKGDGSTKSLVSTGNVTFTTTEGDQRLFWAVCSAGASDSAAGPVAVSGSHLAAYCDANQSGDITPGVPVLSVYGNGVLGLDRTPTSMADPTQGPQVMVWLATINASAKMDVRKWYCGNEIGTSTDVAYTYSNVQVGRYFTTGRSSGKVYELGGVSGSSGAITDAQVDALIHHLCQKYDVDYMPDTTPMDIGLHARSTETVAQTDLCKWHRSDKNLSETAWGLHPLCGALYTTPSNCALQLQSGDDNLALVATAGRKEIRSTSLNSVLIDPTGYNMAETTDFPAMDGGASFACISFADSTGTSGGRFVSMGGTTAFMHWLNTYSAYTYCGSNGSPTGGDDDAWNLLVGRQAFDDDGTGTPDGDSHTWHDKNDYAADVDTNNVTSYGTIKTGVGAAYTGASPQDKARVREMWIWKHKLSEAELLNLKKYVVYRYPDMAALITV